MISGTLGRLESRLVRLKTVLRKRILDAHTKYRLASVQIFAVEDAAARRRGGRDDKCVPEGQPVDDGAVNGVFDEARGGLDDLEDRECLEDGLGRQRVNAECGGCRDEELLQDLRRDDAGPGNRHFGNQFAAPLALERRGAILGVDEDVVSRNALAARDGLLSADM